MTETPRVYNSLAELRADTGRDYLPGDRVAGVAPNSSRSWAEHVETLRGKQDLFDYSEDWSRHDRGQEMRPAAGYSPQAGSGSGIPPEPGASVTAAGAAAIGGAAVGFRGTYGGPQGVHAQNYEILVKAADTANASGLLTSPVTPEMVAGGALNKPVAAETPPSTNIDYVLQAHQNVLTMTGYTPINTFGDQTTQRLLNALDDANRMLAMAGLPTVDKNALVGQILSGQLDAAKLTPDIRDDQFFNNELQKWMQNKVLLSQSYHNIGQSAGVPIPANPFEYSGDLALAALKGGNPKDFTKEAYGFNPGVGDMIGILPGGKGVQETAWDVARTGNAATGSFTPAVQVLNNADGLYGVYGNLAGGVQDTRSAFDVVKQDLPAELPAPFMSVLATSETVYRPNDITLALLGMPDVGGRGTAIKSMLIGISDFAFGGTTITKNTTAPIVVSRDSLEQSGQPMATFKYIGADNRPTDTMVFKVGDPYEKDGVIYQDYKKSDLSKVTIIPTTTTITPRQSGFEYGESQFAEQVTKKILPPVDLPTTGTPADYIIRYAEEAYPGFRDKPLTAAVNAGTILGLTALTAGVVNPYVTGLGSPWLTAVVTKVIPVALAGAYVAELTYSSTLGFTDWSPDAAGRAGYRGGYETIPMIVGGAMYTPLLHGVPMAYRSVARAPEVLSDAIWITRLRASGFTRVEHGSLNYHYTQPKTPNFDNSGGMASWGGTRQTMAPERTVIDLRDVIEFPEYGRPGNVATPAEQAMIMKQYDLTPQEIKMAKRHGLSLNDILSIREMEAVSPVAVAMVEPVALQRVEPVSLQKVQVLTMQMPKILTIDLTGLQVERVPATMLSPLLGTQAIVGSNLIQRLAVMQQEQTRQEVVLGRIPVVDVTPIEKTKTDTMLIPSLFTDTIPIQTTKDRQIVVPVITPEVRPYTGRTPDIVTPPAIVIPPFVPPFIPPYIPSMGGGGGGGMKRGRRKVQVETFYVGPRMKMPVVRMPRR